MKKQGKMKTKLMIAFMVVAVACSFASFIQTGQSMMSNRASAASQELSGQSAELKNLVEQFKLRS